MKRDGFGADDQMAVYETHEFPAGNFADAGRILTRFGRLVDDMRTEVQAAAAAEPVDVAAAAVATDEPQVNTEHCEGCGNDDGPSWCEGIAGAAGDDVLKRAEVAYESYRRVMNSFAAPHWEGLDSKGREAWIVAAAAAASFRS
ncbi:hypothetical protein [Actinomadura geliboluensis]|uniref:hypothetical protein n=1 Tax=Actinomadura geliboluensis TaxID=882440 RepID=UPI002638C9AB|nr:hypothetical protein [Actinomadura geliboluensis]